MPRCIDADKLREDVLDLPNCYNGFSDTYDKARIIDLIDEQPTVWVMDKESHRCLTFPKEKGTSARHAVDAVEVVRCKDCRWQNTPMCWITYRQLLDDYDFCCGGIRREDDYEEPEINPCRGCGDYDGKGGCLSHGGCGEGREDETVHG